jgi:hypothetical protein
MMKHGKLTSRRSYGTSPDEIAHSGGNSINKWALRDNGYEERRF